nr:integrin alpha-X-like [Chrysemys picta bellii]
MWAFDFNGGCVRSCVLKCLLPPSHPCVSLSLAGYSVQVIRSRGQSSYVVGAPRHNHIGKVILFSQDSKRGGWQEETEVLGEQVGSYFGGTLCAVDLNRDGNTDLVLIGAPMYYTPLNGGRVYICQINQQGTMQKICTEILQGQTGQVFGHFGASMSEIGDISGDRQMDVAIGAPMENDNRGALYIFHGEKRGLSPQYRQRIEGSLFPSRLHYFGRAVSGGTDLTGDGLPDIAVGAQGQVLLLRAHVDGTSSCVGLLFLEGLPFQKDCGTDGHCDDQLEISFNFSSLSTLVVGVTPELNTTVSIQNRGENSYSTRVQFFYPAALSYRRVLLLQSNRRAMAVKCSSAVGSEEQTQRTSTCHINHPIFWSGAEAVFVATFDVSSEADLGDRLQITANVSSDNGGPTTERMSHRAELPVKYGIFIILTSLEESTKYVNFSKEAGTSVPVTHRYEVKNLRQRSVPISVTFQFPVELSGVRVWDASEVVPSKPQLAQCTSEAETPGSEDFVKQMSERPLLDCSVATCKKILCKIASLEMQQPLEFMIKGNVSFQWVSQTQQQKVSLVSKAWIEYEEKKYTQKEGFVQRQVQTVVERYEVYNYLPIIVGSSVGGLVLLALITAALYKFGFFKRQYKQMMEDGVEGEGPGPTQSAAAGNPPASDAPKQ